MDFLATLGEVINGPKALALSGLTFAITDALKPVLRLSGGAVKWFALVVAIGLCLMELYFRETPVAAGKPLVKELVTMGATAFAAVFIFAKSRDISREKSGRDNPGLPDDKEKPE